MRASVECVSAVVVVFVSDELLHCRANSIMCSFAIDEFAQVFDGFSVSTIADCHVGSAGLKSFIHYLFF